MENKIPVELDIDQYTLKQLKVIAEQENKSVEDVLQDLLNYTYEKVKEDPEYLNKMIENYNGQ